MDDDYRINLMRAQLAATWFSISLQVSQELLGKSYLSLSPTEKTAVDQAVLAMVGHSYTMVTPQWLAAADQAATPMGFQPPMATASKPSGNSTKSAK